jgi:RNA polymerase sigma factor (sigma-70 family)
MTMNDFARYSDLELLGLISKDSEKALSEIYERYWEKLFDYSEKILKGQSASQDAVQLVFIDLWKRRSSLQINSLQSYLFQAVRFQVFKTIRAGKTSLDFYDRLAVISAKILSENPVLIGDLKDIVEKILNSLPEDQRVLLKLNKQDGFTFKEIAEQKNISVKTVEKKIAKALATLRKNNFGETTVILLVIYLAK